MTSFEASDFYQLDDDLSDEECALRDRVRRWVQAVVLPGVARHFRDGTFPRQWITELAELGALGAHIHGYGCAGLSARAYGLIMRELERGDSGVRTFASVQGALAMTAIHDLGSAEQRQQWLPALAAGEAVACFGLTEPGAGSDPGNMATTAVLSEDGWMINGEKRWIGNGSIADISVVWARTQGLDNVEGGNGCSIHGFLVPRGTAGFEARDMEGKLSMRVAHTSTLHLTNCRLPTEAMLPESAGLKSALHCLNHARFGIAWGAVGAAMACFDEARQYVAERHQFGRPLAATQLVQVRLADMLTDLTQAQLLATRLAVLRDRGTVTPAQISLAKMRNVDSALGIAREARDLLGGVGILDQYQSFRHLANLESVRTYEGTHDIHRLILGQAITRHTAYGG
ncbi:MAG: acyl-CoA dehydrogenase family protein [Candidatus Latescibacterota bacterium]|nr:acyl-CoA dehydrogenase family protein [Candidatus Latescibacterota bacterium]